MSRKRKKKDKRGSDRLTQKRQTRKRETKGARLFFFLAKFLACASFSTEGLLPRQAERVRLYQTYPPADDQTADGMLPPPAYYTRLFFFPLLARMEKEGGGVTKKKRKKCRRLFFFGLTKKKEMCEKEKRGGKGEAWKGARSGRGGAHEGRAQHGIGRDRIDDGIDVNPHGTLDRIVGRRRQGQRPPDGGEHEIRP